MSEKPFIARDTKEPLVVMGGYRIGEGGKIIHDTFPPGEPKKPQAIPSDLDQFARHGLAGLEAKGLFGIIDRLRNSGVIQ